MNEEQYLLRISQLEKEIEYLHAAQELMEMTFG